jgi:Periplasmic component of the Tol biopolymer transport system
MILILGELIFKGEERFLKNVRQITFVGENAEAYFSPSGDKIVFQTKGEGGLYILTKKVKEVEEMAKSAGLNHFKVRHKEGWMFFFPSIYDSSIFRGLYDKVFVKEKFECDQIFVMDIYGFPIKRISPGGANTCAWFLSDTLILFSSTLSKGKECPENPYAQEYLRKRIYVWRLFDYDLYIYNLNRDTIIPLFSSPGYDAEGEGNYGDLVVFTSSKDGDLELYTINIKTRELERITEFPGYDGGAMFSPSGRYIVFRARHIGDSSELSEFMDLLSKNLVKPENVELFIYDTKTHKFTQLTHSPKGVSNFAPYFHPSEKFIVFSSNIHKPGTFSFELYKIDLDGKNLERITYSEGFNSFPMFSKDGKMIIWTSNRGGKDRRTFNVFVAEWKR